MKTVIIKVERTKDGFTAYAENVEGIYAAGNSLLEIKTSILNSIKLLKKNNDPENISKILNEDYQIIYNTADSCKKN